MHVCTHIHEHTQMHTTHTHKHHKTSKGLLLWIKELFFYSHTCYGWLFLEDKSFPINYRFIGLAKGRRSIQQWLCSSSQLSGKRQLQAASVAVRKLALGMVPKWAPLFSASSCGSRPAPLLSPSLPSRQDGECDIVSSPMPFRIFTALSWS